MKELARGAEAVIIEEKGIILKKRYSKKYRIPQIDNPLRQHRTRREAKILRKLNESGIPSPKLISVSDGDTTISMEKIEGIKVRDAIDKENAAKIFFLAGTLTGKLHNNGIIHGDLTTSNMIITKEEDIFIIDFGLSSFSTKDEHKAVDIHVLKQAIDSSHHEIAEKAYTNFIKGYMKEHKEAEEVIKRLEKVESRGRNKQKKNSKENIKRKP